MLYPFVMMSTVVHVSIYCIVFVQVLCQSLKLPAAMHYIYAKWPITIASPMHGTLKVCMSWDMICGSCSFCIAYDFNTCTSHIAIACMYKPELVTEIILVIIILLYRNILE